MSRIQKKKPFREKKKKNSDSESGATDKTTLSSGTKTIALSAPAVKKEKAAIEQKIGEPNFFQKGLEFLREAKVEMKKVTWPTRKQTTGTTIVVIIFVFVVAAFLGLFDYSLSKLVQVVLT
jgi:preprotein translocase subunit SecE